VEKISMKKNCGTSPITPLDEEGGMKNIAMPPLRLPSRGRGSGMKNIPRLPPLILKLAPLIFILVFLLWFSGYLKMPFTSIADTSAKEQFAVMGFSPDSKKLYLEFVDTSHHLRVGWMDLATKQVSLFAPQNTQDELASPSSSADGRQLAIVIKAAASNYEKSQIGVLDLESNTYRAITKSDSYKQFPSFSQDGKKIIYAQPDHKRESGKTRFAGWDIYETDVATGIERRLTDFCFFAVSPPFYLEGGERFVFSGEYPSCNYPSRANPDHFAYEKKYQGNGIFMRRVSGEESPLEPIFQNGKYSDAPFVTQDGKIFFISRTNEIDGIKGGKYNFDIFKYEGGAIKRLTNLKTYLTGLTVSPNGDLATYISDPLRNRGRESWMMDVKNGTYSKISLGDFKSFQVVNVINQ
jgi:Tol biopolymer transport system component